MPKDDTVYLGHMFDAAQKVVARTSGKTRAEYDASEDFQIVLAYLIQTLRQRGAGALPRRKAADSLEFASAVC
jgi:hypothetical protein